MATEPRFAATTSRHGLPPRPPNTASQHRLPPRPPNTASQHDLPTRPPNATRATVKGEMVYYQCLDGKWNMKVREAEINFQDDDGSARGKLEGKTTVSIVAVEGGGSS